MTAPDFSGEVNAAPIPGNVLDHVGNLVSRIRELNRDALLATQNLEAITADINRLTLIAIPEAMEAAGLTELKLKDGAVLKVNDDLKVNINAANQMAAYAWLRENQLGSIIKQQLHVDLRSLESADDPVLKELYEILEAHELTHETGESVHASTLKSVVKELLERGVTPPAAINVHQFKKAVLKEPKERT